ncbi:MAG: hypothetical protein M1828_003848 [Chrysothrix sp. TS-e1954]|nr:MAG: hypothetical protein M1828_003848 [Chrysothrix sp. TS-e1954]
MVINNNTIPITVAEAEEANESKDARDSNYILIQAHEVMSTAQKLALAEHHVTIQEYISDKTYLCHYPGADLAQIRSLDFVKIVNVMHPSLKVSKYLKDAIDHSGEEAYFKVDILLHSEAKQSTGDIGEDLVERRVAAPDTLVSIPADNKIVATVKGSDIAAIASIDSVNRIEEIPEIALCNLVARELLHLDGDDTRKTTFEGSEQLVAVADTGFDVGSTDDGKVHPAFMGRVAHLISVGRKGSGKTDDLHGHGTHVCGSILGNGICNDSELQGQIRGTAPKAKLILQSLRTESGGLDTPEDLRPLFEEAYALGARVHSNSWSGAWKFWVGQEPYDGWAYSVDKFVFEHPEMVICVAAGNDAAKKNHGAFQIGRIAAAKNCITVGATTSKRPIIDKKYSPDLGLIKTPLSVAQFSSRGPTSEGRLKPDIVAPGVAILSAASRGMPTSADVRNECGVCTDADWMFRSGTSMATPLIAGCAAVVREAFQQSRASEPSAALVKAALINGAVIDGNAESDPGHVFDDVQGFGHANVHRSLRSLSDGRGCGYVDADKLKDPGPLTKDRRLWSAVALDVKQDGLTFEATLAYSDRVGKELQNDLNLMAIAANGARRHGNMAEGGEFDKANNVEKLVWSNPPFGELRIAVEVIGGLTLLDEAQGFAAVWSTFGGQSH